MSDEQLNINPKSYTALRPGAELSPDQKTKAYKMRVRLSETLAGMLNIMGRAGAIDQVNTEPFLTLQSYLVWSAAAKDGTSRVPSVSDLTRMELREVFRSPDREQQLIEKPSRDFYKYMNMTGYSDFWADSVWAAHWELPSVTQGYEMYWRLRPGRVEESLVFDRASLDHLLKKQDVAPEYRERLVEVAYAPLTRIDVRRMYRLGSLTKDQVREAYMDLGYDPKNAQLLADFTEKDALPDERGISRSEMGNMYLDGVVSEAELTSWMKEQGYPQADIGLYFRYLTNRKQTKGAEPKDRELTVAQVLDAIEYQFLDVKQGVDRLGRIGFDPVTAKLLIDLDARKRSK